LIKETGLRRASYTKGPIGPDAAWKGFLDAATCGVRKKFGLAREAKKQSKYEG
jgi:hypothetical protein